MTTLLTDNLPLLAVAPNGIEKLRELILELAVRGKLVQQDSSDEPASKLLKLITEEKSWLIAEGMIKKQKPMPEISNQEILFPLPKGWVWLRVGDLALSILSGGTPSKNIPEYWGGAIPWASVKDLNVYRDLVSTQDYITKEGLDAGSKLASKGDVLICTRMGLGKIAIAAMDVAINQDLKALKLTRHIDIDYFLNFYRTLRIVGSGMTVAGIKQEELRGYCVPLPPLAEQHRIVAKVDELMALCDRIDAQQTDAESVHDQLLKALLDSLTRANSASDFAASWQRLSDNFQSLFTTEASINTLKQTLLQLAVMGKLVPTTTQGVQSERDQYSHPGLLYKVPMHWDVKRLDQISQTIVDCPHSTPKWTESGVICVRTSQFKAGSLDLSSSKYVSEETYLERTQRLEPKENDILYSREGGILGIACRIPGKTRLCLGQRMMLIRPHNNVLPEFLEMVLNSPLITSIARNLTTGGAAPRVNVSVVKAYPIPLPPLAEQHCIVAKVDQVMTLCDQLKARLIQARQLNKQLASTLIGRALTEDSQQFPITTDRKIARTLLAAEITHRLHSQRTFGQRKLQKVLYLSEHVAKLAAIQGDYLRDAAGPHDRQLMSQIESELQNRKWYERIERENVGYAYQPLSQAGQHQQAYESAWLAGERASIEQIIKLMRGWDTDRCEMIVTLYAAWNDFILEGRPVIDEAIVDEVMHSWNDTKLRFSKTEWLAVLAEMKKHKILMPTGFGKRTTGGMLSLPGFD